MGACEMTGRVVWRGAFKGDAQVEALVRTVASNGLVATPANANFVLYDKGTPWTGWFVGVAATCPPPRGSSATGASTACARDSSSSSRTSWRAAEPRSEPPGP